MTKQTIGFCNVRGCRRRVGFFQ